MKRYELDGCDGGYCRAQMEENPKGEWVRYEDIAEAEKENEKLKAWLREAYNEERFVPAYSDEDEFKKRIGVK